MKVGDQFHTPRGLHSLKKDVTYYFLQSQRERVLCVEFIERNDDRVALLHILRRDIFEAALVRGDATSTGVQAAWPPWLSEFEGQDLRQVDAKRRKAIRAHRDRVVARATHIHAAVQDAKRILSSANPDGELNRFARACSPSQHEPRFRLWFYVYLLFRQDMWSLLPPFHHAGHWSRDSASFARKFGRPSKDGSEHGYNATSMATRIVESYVKWVRIGRTRSRIYAIAMVNDFGCKAIRESKRKTRIFHPEGSPFPSIDQFYYYVEKAFGLRAVRREKVGTAGMRSEAPSQGSYSQATSNLSEVTEADGYYTKDEPTPFIPGTRTSPICCVQIVCVASGMRIGFGGTPGAERSVAYREALFSAAIGMEKYFSLLGLPLETDGWPTAGLPAELIPDRGPGGSAARIDDVGARVPIVSLTPSYAGQSKATVESANPRSTHLEGRPTVVLSKLSVVQMFRREILFAKKANHSSDATDRLTPEMVAAGVPANPLGIFDFLDERARNDGISVPFDRAVRAYLTPVEFTVRDDGVWLEGQRYDSKELRKTDLLDRAARAQVFAVPGYVLQMCVRTAWIEVKGAIVEVEAQLRLRDNEEQLYITYQELKELEEIRRGARREQKKVAIAEEMAFVQECIAETGALPDAGKRVPRRKRGARRFERHSVN